MRQNRTLRASSVRASRWVWLGWAISCSLSRGDYDGPLSTLNPRNTHLGGLLRSFDEDLRLRWPRHANDSLLLWRVFLYSSREHDHRHLCLLRRALAHGAYEGLAHAPIQPGDEEQQVCTV